MCSGCSFYRVVPGGKSESDEFVCWNWDGCPYQEDEKDEEDEE